MSAYEFWLVYNATASIGLVGLNGSSQWEDVAGSSLHGTAVGAVWEPSGGPGPDLPGCWSLDGVDDHVWCPDDAAIRLHDSSQGTHGIWVWVPEDNASDDFAVVFGKGSGGGYEFRHFDGSQNSTPNQLSFSPRATVGAASSIPKGEWVFWVMSRYTQGGDNIVTLRTRTAGDGSMVLVDQYATTSSGALYPTPSHTGNLFFGARGGSERHFHGKVAGYFSVPYVMTVATMDDGYNAAMTGSVPEATNPVAWRYDPSRVPVYVHLGNQFALPEPDPVVASFFMSPSPVDQFADVTLDGSASTGATSWEWDDAVSQEDPTEPGTWPLGSGPVVTRSFLNPGVKQVRLRVTGPGGSDELIQPLTVEAVSSDLPAVEDVDATVNDMGAVPISRSYALSFDGDRDKNDGAGFRTSIWSDGAYVYVGMNAANTANTQLLSDVARYSKATGAELERVRLDTTGADTDDGLSGHSAVSLGIDGAGRIFGRRAGHNDYNGLLVRRTTVAGDLSTFVSIPEPSRPGGTGWRDNYRRFFRAPDGSMWLWTRSNEDPADWPESMGLLWRYDVVNNQLVNVVGGGATPLQLRAGTRTFNWDMMWRDGEIWGVSSVLATGTSGFPVLTNATAGRSADGGQTWTDLAGSPITLPFDHETGTSIFPNKHHRPAVVRGSNNLPVFVAPWSGPSNDTHLSLWVRAYNPATNEIMGRRLDTEWSESREHAAIALPDGGIAVVARHPSNGRHHLYVTRPGPDWLDVWDRWELAGWDYGYCYLDPNCGDDGVIRALAVERDGQGAVLVETNYTAEAPSEPGVIAHGTDVDDTNTGLLTSEPLQTVTSAITTSSHGQTIEYLDLRATPGSSQPVLRIQHNNVTVRFCRIAHPGQAHGIVVNSGVTGALIEFCEIDGELEGWVSSTGSMSIINDGNATIRRNKLIRYRSGIRNRGHGSVVEENFLVGNFNAATSGFGKGSGISSMGGNGLTIARNHINLTASQSAGIPLYADWAAVQNHTVIDNLIIGHGGGFGTYGGDVHSNRAQNQNIVYTGNRFDGYFEFPNVLGEGTNAAVNMNRPGAVWTNNRWVGGTVDLPPRCGVSQDACE